MIRLDMDDETYAALWRYSRDHQGDAPEIRTLYDLLDDKLDRIIARRLYTASKTAPTPEAREAARREYLERRLS